MTNFLGRLLLPVAAVAALACSSTSPSPGVGNTRLVLTVDAGTPAAAPTVAKPDTVKLGGDVLVLTQVDVVLRKIELKRLETAGGCNDADDVSGSEGSNEHNGVEAADEDCEEVDAGPLLVSLPLGGATSQQVEVAVMPGTYRKVEFQIHKPDDGDAGDTAFLTANPDFRRVSIRARGTFNGTAFEFVTDLTAEQELAITPPLVLAQDEKAKLTLNIDVHGWFIDADHNRLVNPATALKGQPGEALVKQNIRSSIRAHCEHEDH